MTAIDLRKDNPMLPTMWEILVPTTRRIDGKPIRKRFHKAWDRRVRAITGGLTILPPAKGQWVCPTGVLYEERMIPVRIVATVEQMDEIIDMTMIYYDQLAILAYEIGRAILRNREEINPEHVRTKSGRAPA